LIKKVTLNTYKKFNQYFKKILEDNNFEGLEKRIRGTSTKCKKNVKK